jgi:uncharacterized membrane protein
MLAAEAFELVFRVIHIMFGVAWAGSAFLFTVFIEPAAASLGPAAGPFMEEVADRRKVPEIITVIAAVAVIGGWVLWFNGWQDFGSLGDWIGSSYGLWLTIGGVAATAAFFAGVIGIPPNLKKLAAIGREIEATGGPPTPEQGARMHAIQERMRLLGRVDLGLLAVAVFAMATARYW